MSSPKYINPFISGIYLCNDYYISCCMDCCEYINLYIYQHKLLFIQTQYIIPTKIGFKSWWKILVDRIKINKIVFWLRTCQITFRMTWNNRNVNKIYKILFWLRTCQSIFRMIIIAWNNKNVNKRCGQVVMVEIYIIVKNKIK